ncbi:MAG: hypothetical protein E7426_00980 [Ruminococcaceae bacterium]|jgi:hypothetical protein|nr:hypothetical protein [Oscillospiraceae bacterium]
MDNQELRTRKEELGLSDFKVNYKTGVHLGVIEDFFAGRTETLDPRDRKRIEDLIEAEGKKK